MLGLRTTIYKVSDLAKATEWYSKAFEIKPYYNESYYVGFNLRKSQSL
jgi:lactoylglutathione lyase